MLVDLIRVLHCHFQARVLVEKTRQDKMKNKMKEKKTEIMMWTDAESKFGQEKAKLAN